MILLWKETFYDDFMTVLRNVALLALLFMRIYGRCWCRCIKGKWVIKQVSWLIKFWHQINNLSRHYYYPQYPQNIHLQGVWLAQQNKCPNSKQSDCINKESSLNIVTLDGHRCQNWRTLVLAARVPGSSAIVSGGQHDLIPNITTNYSQQYLPHS